MKTNSRVVLATIIIQFLFAITAMAQADKESQSSLAYLLSLQGVAKELEMSDIQNERLFSLWIELKFELDQEFRKHKSNLAENLSEVKKAELQNDFEDALAKIRKTELERLEEALLPQQIERLNQLRFQLLASKEDGLVRLKKELELTSTQVQEIDDIRDSLHREIKSIKGGVRAHSKDNAQKKTADLKDQKEFRAKTPTEMADAIDELRQEAKTKISNVLTATQKKKLQALQGTPYDFNAGSQTDSDKVDDTKRANRL